jgi:hypothetical protein
VSVMPCQRRGTDSLGGLIVLGGVAGNRGAGDGEPRRLRWWRTGRIFRRFRAALPHELDGRLRKTDFPAYIERVAELELDQRELCKRVAYAVELMEQRAKPSKDEQDFIDMMREDGWV